MKFSGKINNGTRKKPLNFGSDLWPWQRFVYVCLLAGLLKKLSMDFDKIFRKDKDDTSNKPLNCGSDPCYFCLSVSILLENL